MPGLFDVGTATEPQRTDLPSAVVQPQQTPNVGKEVLEEVAKFADTAAVPLVAKKAIKEINNIAEGIKQGKYTVPVARALAKKAYSSAADAYPGQESKVRAYIEKRVPEPLRLGIMTRAAILEHDLKTRSAFRFEEEARKLGMTPERMLELRKNRGRLEELRVKANIAKLQLGGATKEDRNAAFNRDAHNYITNSLGILITIGQKELTAEGLPQVGDTRSIADLYGPDGPITRIQAQLNTIEIKAAAELTKRASMYGVSGSEVNNALKVLRDRIKHMRDILSPKTKYSNLRMFLGIQETETARQLVKHYPGYLLWSTLYGDKPPPGLTQRIFLESDVTRGMREAMKRVLEKSSEVDPKAVRRATRDFFWQPIEK